MEETQNHKRSQKFAKGIFVNYSKKKRFAIMFKKELGNDLKLKGFKKYEIYRHKELDKDSFD